MNDFLSYIKECVDIFKQKKSDRPIRILGHLDCDGICSSSILIKTFYREGVKLVYSSHKQVDEQVIKEIQKEPYEIVFFVDFGSNVLNFINQYLNEKTVFILDHHKYEELETKHYNINQNKFKLDDNIICGSGIAYLFSKYLNPKNKDSAYLALIGLIGDNQEKELSSLNKAIINDAVESGEIDVKVGLSIFGSQTKPLHKLLEYSTEIFIPGVTGSETGAIQFLEKLGINSKDINGEFRKIFDLSKEEMNKLITAIIITRIGSESDPENIFGNIYTLKNEENGNPTKDAKEFSTLLNACGRLNKTSLGVGTCLNDKKIKQKAFDLLKQYKIEIINSLNWVYNNKDKLIEKENLVIINAQNNVKDTIIGTINSVLTRSGLYKNGTLVVSMAYTPDKNIKISLRNVDNGLFDLSLLIKETCTKMGGVGGGHPNAAGGNIPLNKEKEFIDEIISKVNLIKQNV